MTETGGVEDDVTHSPLKAKSPNKGDEQSMDVEVDTPKEGSNEDDDDDGSPKSKPLAMPGTPSTGKVDPNCFKTPEPRTPSSSAKKRKRLTPEEKNLKDRERQEKRRKLEEEKQKKEQEKLDKAKQREAEKQQREAEKLKKDEEKRRQEEEKKQERLKKEEERKKLEEERKQERLKKEEEKKRLEEEKLKDRLKKEEERKKKEEEKRLKMEEKEREQKKLEQKKAKQAQLFTNFFQKASSPKVQIIEDGNVCLAPIATANVVASTEPSGEKSNAGGAASEGTKNTALFNPLPFQIKTDMVVAPLYRRKKLSALDKSQLDSFIESANVLVQSDFLKSIKNHQGRKSAKTELKKESEIQVIDDNSQKPDVCMSGYLKWRMKLLQFHDNRRPAYWGTWKRKSKCVIARRPLAREEEIDYDFDSDDEWEDEPEDAEELVDSDKEEKEDKDNEEGEEEDEEGWMVPHGYLSDSEREGNHSDLESMKTKEKEFYKSLKKKSMMEYPFIETTNLTCYSIRICPVFRSADPVKPIRKRKPKAKVIPVEVDAVPPPTPLAAPVQEEENLVKPSPPSEAPPKTVIAPAKNESSKPKRIRKVPDSKHNPYAQPPSGFLALELPSDDEEDMDWDCDDRGSGSSEEGSDESGDSSGSDDESDSEDDLFTPVNKNKNPPESEK